MCSNHAGGTKTQNDTNGGINLIELARNGGAIGEVAIEGAFKGVAMPSENLILQCMHCGMARSFTIRSNYE